MMIHFPGDPVRGEAAQARATQMELGPNSGVFASILSALSGGWKPSAEESENTPLVSPESSTSLTDPEAPSSDTITRLEAPDHPSTDTIEKPAAPPETVDSSSDKTARLAVPASKHFNDFEKGIGQAAAPDSGVSVPDLPALDHREKQSEAVFPSRKTHLPDGGVLATEQTRDRSLGAEHTIRPESTDTSGARSFDKAVTGPAFTSPSHEGKKQSESTVSPVPRNGLAGTPTATTDGVTVSAHSAPATESPPTVPGKDPLAFEAAPTRAEPVPYARSLGNVRAAQIGVATSHSLIDGVTVQPPPIARGGERGDGRNVPLSSALAVSAPDAPLIEAIRAAEKHGHMTLLSTNMRRTDGPAPPTPALDASTPAPTPRNGTKTSPIWNGAAPEPIMAPADLFARPAQRGIAQAAGAWLAPVDDGAFSAPSGGSLANQSASAPPPDLVTFQPRPAAEPARDVARQIGAQILNLGKGRFEMSLSPAELGRVEMWLQDTDNRLTLTINAERPETLDLIRRHIGLLEQEMRQLGYGGLSLQLGADGSPGSHTAHKPAAALNQHEGIGTSPERELGMRPQALSADHLDIRL